MLIVIAILFHLVFEVLFVLLCEDIHEQAVILFYDCVFSRELQWELAVETVLEASFSERSD